MSGYSATLSYNIISRAPSAWTAGHPTCTLRWRFQQSIVSVLPCVLENIGSMSVGFRGVQLSGFQQHPSGICPREPVSLGSFELEPSTSYEQVENGSGYKRCSLSIRSPKRRRRKWRTLELASATAALQQNALQHDCFAVLGAQIRKSVRNQMMGWPADVRRFLAGAFAGVLQPSAVTFLQ